MDTCKQSSLNLSPITPHLQFTREDINKAFEEGKIDDIDRYFLVNVLGESVLDSEVVNAVNLYRWRIGNGLKPGQELFIRMNEIGLKHHPLTDLDISGYNLPEVYLDGAIVRNLDMSCTVVNGMVRQGGIKADNIHQEGMKAYYVEQGWAEIKGTVIQNGARINTSLKQKHIKASCIQQFGLVANIVDQSNGKVKSVDQQSLEANIVNQDRIKVGSLDQSNSKIGNLKQ